MERWSLSAWFNLVWTAVLLLLLLLLLLCTFDAPVTLAQSVAGFVNIDCGAATTSVDTVTGLTWQPDLNYISSIGKVQTVTVPASLATFTELKTIRFFDDPRLKNCYKLSVTDGATYLLRATFFYGNYDNANKPPSFQLGIDATILDDVYTTSADMVYKEYHYVAQGDTTYVCLVRKPPGLFNPFISGLSLKPAAKLSTGFSAQYFQLLQQGVIMKTLTRVNYGATQLVRGPDDNYDRFWVPEGPSDVYYLSPTTAVTSFLSTTSTFASLVNNDADQPSAVMQTAVTSNDSISSLLLPPSVSGVYTNYTSLYVTVYYAELLDSVTPVPRNFTVQIPGGKASINMEGVFLRSGGWDFWPDYVRVSSTSTVNMTRFVGSLAGPILNAMEVFAKSNPRANKTVNRDALAIEDIKMSMRLTEWTGDPCLPSPHPWITCNSSTPVSPMPQITELKLSGYKLEGPIPASIANLLSLTSLSLDNNSLSGSLPAWLTDLPNLRVLSIQNNNFSGSIPSALLAANSPIQFKCNGNPLLIGCPGSSACVDCGSKSNIAAIVGGIIGGVVVLSLLLVVAIVVYRRNVRNRRSAIENDEKSTKRIVSSGGAKSYSYAEIKAATSRFSRELGRGGFGPVYYGKLPNGQEVAVKVGDVSSKQGQKEFFNEVEVLSKVHHKNLVSLVGYSDDQKPILVYEYMQNGSLFDHLHGTSTKGGKLDWRTRLHIALNAAQGLEYLHAGCSPSFIHRDVKSSNILLTPKFQAKVADFGVAKLLGEADFTRVMTDVMGTAGYVDPEYYTTQYLSIRSDVYSFGVVLLELITGRFPIDQVAVAEGRNAHIVHWVREKYGVNDFGAILDPTMKSSWPRIEVIYRVVDIALQSVDACSLNRPTMSKVVEELQDALALEKNSSLPSY